MLLHIIYHHHSNNMQFINKLATLAIAAATAVQANTVTFVSQDSTSRTIIFTPTDGQASVDSITVAGGATETVTIPQGWIGNWYSVSEGAADTPGMLGEVTFQGWNGLTYFDVSAIVNPTDFNGVQKMYPASEASVSVNALTTFSGCAFSGGLCNTVYISSDDVQTVTTTETDLYCTLGQASQAVVRDESPHLVERKFVLGKF